MLEKTYLQLKKKIEKLRKEYLDFVDDFLTRELKTEDGSIISDPTLIPKFQSEMESFFNDKGIAFLASLVAMIRKVLQEAANNFEEEGAQYADVKYMEDILGIKGGVVQRKRNGHPTVLYAIASMSVIRTDIINKMQGAFIGDTSLGDFRKAVNSSVRRKFHDFFEVNAVASLFNTYNAANRYFAKKYNYTKFRYEGGLIADSRDFCVERDGHEFHVYQGEEWNELEWKGKIPGVDFFVQIGGYNCRHWLEYSKG